MAPARSDDTTQIAVTIDDKTTSSCAVIINDKTKKEVQRNGFFSRVRRLRGGRRVVQVPGASKEGTIILDESITVDETDDEDSSFSFVSCEHDNDIIDQLLSRKPVVVILDNVDKVVDKMSTSLLGTATTIQTQTVTKHVTTYDELGLSNDDDHHSSSSSSSIHSCLKLLSSHDLDQNRLGLQRLILLTKGRSLSGSSSGSSCDSVSKMLVFGGPFGSIEEQLRYIFATMICNCPHSDNRNHNHDHEYGSNNNNNNNDDDNDDDDDDNDDDDDDDDYYDGDYFDDYRNEEEALFNWILDYNSNEVNLDSSSNRNNDNDDGNDDDDNNNDKYKYSNHDEECSSASYNSSFLDQQHKERKLSHQHPEGKATGILHNHALRVLANALENVLSSSLSPSSQSQPATSFLLVNDNNSPIWKNIIHSLVNNIHRPNRNWNATGYSLKILRLLCEIMNNDDTAVTTNGNNDNNNMILPLLRYSLFTQLVYLIEYGKSHHFPMIYKEASYLLRLCDKS